MGLVHSIHSIIFQTEFYLVLTVSRCCSWGMTFLDTAPLCLLYPGRRVNSQKGCGMGKPMRGVRSLTARDSLLKVSIHGSTERCCVPTREGSVLLPPCSGEQQDGVQVGRGDIAGGG